MEISVPLKKIEADNRFPLAFYYRIANQLVNQAKVYRDDQNVDDLCTTLNRYCRLFDVIPQHRSYSTYSAKEKLHHNKIHKEFVKELEILKPLLGRDLQSPNNHSLSCSNKGKVKCCGTAVTKSQRIYEEKTGLVSVMTIGSAFASSPLEPLCSAPATTDKDWNVHVHVVTQSVPSPAISHTESMPQAAHIWLLTSDSRNDHSKSSVAGSSESKVLQDIHISARLMEDFLELARDNTNKDLETCGVLGAFLKKGTFYVTTLIVPKQESASNSCQALNEEEIYAIQDEQSLVPIGWIHTHPSQGCFMSSIDLHTHYSYQVMLPEAFAIVMAPTDKSRYIGVASQVMTLEGEGYTEANPVTDWVNITNSMFNHKVFNSRLCITDNHPIKISQALKFIASYCNML